MDGVEHASGGAETAADTPVLIHHTDAAAQAAAGFGFYLLLGEGEAVMLEAAGLLLIVQDGLAGRAVRFTDVVPREEIAQEALRLLGI